MKIPNKPEVKQIVYKHSSNIDFTAKSYSSLVIDDTLASDNALRFRKNLLERI